MSGIHILRDRYEVDGNDVTWVYDCFSDFAHLPGENDRDGILMVRACPECGGELRSTECRGQNPILYTFSHYYNGDWWGQECPPEH